MKSPLALLRQKKEPIDLGLAWLGAIGFTMSLFIASLAFDGVAALPAAKVGILTASIVAGIVGWSVLRGATPSPENTKQ